MMSSEEGDQQFLIDGRLVAELKVVELRKELEQRSLPKSGNKKELVDRLVNFLKDEYNEQKRQKTQQFAVNQQQQQQNRSPPMKSPLVSTMPDMVAQYLAQQQIQLEAARRDADKLRISTSSVKEATFEEQEPIEMVTQVVEEQQQQQLTTAANEDTEKHLFKDQGLGQHAIGGEFIPEEPTTRVTSMIQPQNFEQEKQLPEQSMDQQKSDNDGSTSGVQVEASSETEKGYESDTEDEADEQKSESSSRTENEGEKQPDFDTATEQKDTTAGQFEEADKQVIESMEEDEQQHIEGEVEEEQKQEDTSTEFVPDEPDAHKQANKNVIPNESSTTGKLQDEEIDFEHHDLEVPQKLEEDEDEDEEREEPDDYGGKRHRRREQSELQDSNVSSASNFEHTGLATTKPSSEIDDNEKNHQVVSNLQHDTGEQQKHEEEDESMIQVVANEKPPPSPPAQISIPGRSRLSASAAAESSKPPAEPEITQDGFLRRRPASPARNPASRWIHIRGLKRPYTQRSLLDLLGKFGTVDQSEFWIDSIKSNCIVTFETVEQAELARERLHNVVWPPASSDALCVEFSSEQKLKRRRADETKDLSALGDSIEPAMIGHTSTAGLGLTIVVDNRGDVDKDGPQVLIQHEKEHQREMENRKRKAEELEKSQNTLDQLFKKTTTQPSLYYLPLSDAEAAKRPKSKASSSAKQQVSKSSSSSHRHSSSDRHHHSSSAAHKNSTGGATSSGRDRDHRQGATTTTSGRSNRR